MADRMQPILGKPSRPGGSQQVSSAFNRRTVGAAIALAVIAVSVYLAIHQLVELIHNFPPATILLPLTAIAGLTAAFPLIMFMSYQNEFGNMNPLYPPHYLFLARRVLAALRANDLKVSAKDL